MHSPDKRLDQQRDDRRSENTGFRSLRALGLCLHDKLLHGGLGWFASCLSGLTLAIGCSHAGYHGKCPPPGDCVGYPSGLCAGYYPTCWRLWPAECPSCPVEPAPMAVPATVPPPTGEAAPVIVPGEDYLTPEQAPPLPEVQPQPVPPRTSTAPSSPRAAHRLKPIRSRPVPRVDDAASAGPPPRPIAQAATNAEPVAEPVFTAASAPRAVRVVAEVRSLPPVQEVPAVRPAAVRVPPPIEWGELVAELPAAKPIERTASIQSGPVMPIFTAPAQPAVRPVQRKLSEPAAAFQPTVRAAGPLRR